MPFDETKEEPLTEPDTLNSTKFHATEGQPPANDPQYWQRLRNINTGAVDSFGNNNKEIIREQERVQHWDVIAGEANLCLTAYQKAEGRRLINSLDLRSLGGRLTLACFCVAALVVSWDHHSERVFHPRRADRNNCELFMDVFYDNGFDSDRVHGYLNRVEAQLT